MSIQQVSCVYRGNTFFGQCKVIAGNPDPSVCVRYKGEELEAKAANGASTEEIAKTLLQQLVMREFIAITVTSADGHAGAPEAAKGEQRAA